MAHLLEKCYKARSLKEVYSGLTMERLLQRHPAAVPEARAYADNCTLTFTCTADIASPGQEMASTLAPDKTPNRPHLPQARFQSTGDQPPFSWKQKNTPPGVSQHLGVEFDLASHTPATSGRSPKGCCLETELHPTRAHLLDAQGVGTLYNHKSLPDGIPPLHGPCPPSYSAL
ncbi:hypothetical protein GWK47_031542 [Chionoecetes opilio]|uniref:Uncharacterized protein n=1 Tax=Chionoecetes opilio TaxID=41210 RepID=A0A8J5D4S9_CHIOP|nr:hypothetical protein GWK47_031542 [Chionoecetes opilio]